MTKSQIIASGFFGLTTSLTRYYPISGGLASVNATETNKKTNLRPAGVLSRLAVNVVGNAISATTTVRLRKNGANANQVVSISSNTSGLFEDTTNTDSFAVGDDLNYSIVTGATGTSINVNAISIIFDPTDTSITSTKFSYNGLGSYTSASAQAYFPISGVSSTGTVNEGDAQLKIKKAGTLKNLDVRVTANSRTTNTAVRTRKNGADGAQAISIGSTATGEFEDTTNSDTVAVDDLINFNLATSTGTQGITIESMSVNFESSSRMVPLIAGSLGSTVNAAVTWGSAIGGVISYAEPSSASTVEMNFSTGATIQNLLAKVLVNNNTATSTVKIVKNGTDSSMSVSIGAFSTGNFEDNTNTFTIVDGDDLYYTHTTSGSGTITNVYYVCYAQVTAPASTYFKTVNVLSNSGTGLQSITHDEEWTPKVAIVRWSRANTSIDTFQEHMSTGIGFTDGTNQRCIATASEDNQARGDSARIQRNNALICTLNPSGTMETVDAVATFSSWLSNGMQINWTDAPAAAFYLQVLFIGGDFITDVTVGTLASGTGTGDISVTSLAYQPDFGMFLSAGSATENTAVVGGFSSIGAATSSSAQWVQGIYSQDNPVTMITNQYYSHGKVVVSFTNSAVDGYATFSSYNSNGFTLNVGDAFPASHPIYYLLINGGVYAVGNSTEIGSVTTQSINTGLDTKAVMIFGLDTGTADAVQSGCMQTIGMGTGSSSQGVGVFEDINGIADSVVVSRHDTDQIYLNITANATAGSTTLDDEAALSSVSSSGFVLNWTNIGQARPFRYIGFGASPVLTEVTKQVTLKFNIVSQVIKVNTLKFSIVQKVTKQTSLLFSIYNSVVKTNSLLFSILQKMEKSNTLKFDVRSQVVKTNTLLFTLLNSLTKTNTLKFDVRNEVAKSNTIRFDILQQVIKQLSILFDVESIALTPVTKTVTLLFSILEEVEKTNTLKFDIRNKVEKSTTLKFNIMQQIVKQLNILFSIDQKVTKQLSILFSVLNTVEKSNTIKFSIRNEIEKLTTLKFDIRQQVAKDTTLLFDVIARVTKTTSLKFDIRSVVESTNTILFDVLNQITPKIVTLMFDIRNSVEKDTTIKFDVVQQVVKQLAVKFDILQRMTKTNTLLFDIEAVGVVIKSLNLKFDILQRVESDTALKFDIRNEIDKLVSLHFDVLQQAAKSVNVKFDIRQPVTKTTTVKFNILNEIEKLLTLKFDLNQEATNTTRLKFDIRERVEKTNTLRFHIRNQIDRALTILFSINQLVEKDTTLKFDIIQRITKLQTLRFDIEDSAQLADVINDILELTSEFYAAVETTRVLGRSQDETPL